MKYKIYKLVYQGEIIYIGKTIQKYLSSRKTIKYSKIPKEIVKLSSIELIEETDDILREDYWIVYYRELGINLYNIRRGDGIHEDYKRKEYLKEYREYNKEKIKKYKKEYHEKNKYIINKTRREQYKIKKSLNSDIKN